MQTDAIVHKTGSVEFLRNIQATMGTVAVSIVPLIVFAVVTIAIVWGSFGLSSVRIRMTARVVVVAPMAHSTTTIAGIGRSERGLQGWTLLVLGW